MYFGVVVIFLLVPSSFSLSPQCRDESGLAVDWFYLYKLPREKNHPNPLVRKGLAYMYLSPSKLRQGWILSNLGINHPNSLFGMTLAPLYEEPKNILSLVYNDQPPNNTQIRDPLLTLAEMYTKASTDTSSRYNKKKKHKKFKLGDNYYDDYDLSEMCKIHAQTVKTRLESGHTKGVVLGDKISAFWLVHSVPKFPPIPDSKSPQSSYDYPVTGQKYGQTALCITVPISTLNDIGLQLEYNEPLIVHSNIPLELRNLYPNIEDVIHGKKVVMPPWYHIQSFESVVGRRFVSFAKSGRFNDDLYSGLVAEALQSDLLVETWTNGPGPLDSECNRNFQVRNIEWVRFPTTNLSFTSHSDHSKWAVAVAHKIHNSQDAKVADYWVCVGDINRAFSQESRGGGTVCTSGPILWGNFAHLVEAVENCKP